MSSLLRSCEINEYELFVEFDKSGVFCGVFIICSGFESTIQNFLDGIYCIFLNRTIESLKRAIFIWVRFEKTKIFVRFSILSLSPKSKTSQMLGFLCKASNLAQIKIRTRFETLLRKPNITLTLILTAVENLTIPCFSQLSFKPGHYSFSALPSLKLC